jgi:hypothetical protein
MLIRRTGQSSGFEKKNQLRHEPGLSQAASGRHFLAVSVGAAPQASQESNYMPGPPTGGSNDGFRSAHGGSRRPLATAPERISEKEKAAQAAFKVKS